MNEGWNSMNRLGKDARTSGPFWHSNSKQISLSPGTWLLQSSFRDLLHRPPTVHKIYVSIMLKCCTVMVKVRKCQNSGTKYWHSKQEIWIYIYIVVYVFLLYTLYNYILYIHYIIIHYTYTISIYIIIHYIYMYTNYNLIICTGCIIHLFPVLQRWYDLKCFR